MGPVMERIFRTPRSSGHPGPSPSSMALFGALFGAYPVSGSPGIHPFTYFILFGVHWVHRSTSIRGTFTAQPNAPDKSDGPRLADVAVGKSINGTCGRTPGPEASSLPLLTLHGSVYLFDLTLLGSRAARGFGESNHVESNTWSRSPAAGGMVVLGGWGATSTLFVELYICRFDAYNRLTMMIKYEPYVINMSLTRAMPSTQHAGQRCTNMTMLHMCLGS